MNGLARKVLGTVGLTCLLATPVSAASRDFDGDDDKIVISDVGILQGSGAASYAVWVNVDALPAYPGTTSLIRKDGEFNLQLNCYQSQQGFNGAVWGPAVGSWPSQARCNYTLTTGVWHHLVIRWDKTVATGDAQILVDGALACTVNGDDTGNVANSANALMLGNNEGNTEDFNGRMAHVRVFNKRLSDAEVAQEQTSPGSVTAGLVGHWPLAGASPEPDVSGNNNNSSSILGTTVSPESPPTGGGDTTPPTGSISINNNAAATNTTNVTLTLSASDPSGVSEMQLSNDNISYDPAVAYVTSKPWTLTIGDGTKTVYVKFKDAVGNWSAAATDTITLDTTAPQVTITSPSNGAIITAQ